MSEMLKLHGGYEFEITHGDYKKDEYEVSPLMFEGALLRCWNWLRDEDLDYCDIDELIGNTSELHDGNRIDFFSNYPLGYDLETDTVYEISYLWIQEYGSVWASVYDRTHDKVIGYIIMPNV